MSRLRVPRFALLLSALAGCGGDGASDPSPRIDEIFLSVDTEEIELGRQLMVVGEAASAHVIAFRNSIGTDPGSVSFTSSSPAVVSVQATAPAHAELAAVAPGSVQIVASAQGLTDQVRVDVVESPLPVDPVQVRLAPVSSEVEGTYDTQGNLVGIALAPGGSAALDLTVRRGGTQVMKIPFSLISSEPSAVRVDEHCRAPELDPDCSIFGTWGWVSGLQVGESLVTVTVRNQSASFVVVIR
jgi:hypothetical protein